MTVELHAGNSPTTSNIRGFCRSLQTSTSLLRESKGAGQTARIYTFERGVLHAPQILIIAEHGAAGFGKADGWGQRGGQAMGGGVYFAGAVNAQAAFCCRARTKAGVGGCRAASFVPPTQPAGPLFIPCVQPAGHASDMCTRHTSG